MYNLAKAMGSIVVVGAILGEIALSGLVILELLKAQALDKLIPDSIFQIVVNRFELSAYGPKLPWLKAQIEYAKGAAQTVYVSDPFKELHEAGPDPAQNRTLFWDLQEATQRCAQSSDWARSSAATAALQQLYAVSEGKGGKGTGKFAKGWKAT